MKKHTQKERDASVARVRSLRSATGLSAEAFARLAGVSTASIRSWEYGERVITAPMLVKLQDAAAHAKSEARA